MPESSLFADIQPPADIPPTGTVEHFCTECGAGPLPYSGRGRPPTKCEEHKRPNTGAATGTPRRSTASDKQLTTACDSLRQLYDVLTIPLAALNPDAGNAWLDQINALDARNRTILATNPDLVRKINQAGQKSGNFAFAMSHAVAVLPVALIVIGQARVNAADRKANREAQQAVAYPDGIPADEYAFVAHADGTTMPPPLTDEFFDRPDAAV